jgi:hypothetical protein
MDDLKLLGLQRAEFEVAEKSQSMSDRLQFTIFIVSILVIALEQEWVSYAGGVLNVLLALSWQFYAYKGRRSHYIAERARRAVLLSGGLGVNVTGKLYSDILMQFTVSEPEGRKYEDPNYFKAYGPQGYKRLAAMLQESAFWTKHLFDKSAGYYWWAFGIGLIIAVVGLLLMPSVTEGSACFMVAQIFCVLLVWLVTGGVFTRALNYTTAARAVDDVENRLNNAVSGQSLENDLVVILGDYNAIVQDAPTIPTSIYQRNREQLNRLWSESRESNG